MATTDDLYNVLTAINDNLIGVTNSSGSWQTEYLAHNWQYRAFRSNTLPQGYLPAQMGTTVTVINEEIYGLVHFIIVNLTGSLDLRDMIATVSESQTSGTGGALFMAHLTDDLFGAALEPSSGAPFLAQFDDSNKTYTAVFAPSNPIPVHSLVIKGILPPPVLEPSVTEVALNYDILTSQMLNTGSRATINSGGVVTYK